MNIILVIINSYICWKKESVQKDYKMTMFPMRKELQENVTPKREREIIQASLLI